MFNDICEAQSRFDILLYLKTLACKLGLTDGEDYNDAVKLSTEPFLKYQERKFKFLTLITCPYCPIMSKLSSTQPWLSIYTLERQCTIDTPMTHVDRGGATFHIHRTMNTKLGKGVALHPNHTFFIKKNNFEEQR